MTTTIKTTNGTKVTRSIRKEDKGYSRNVWFGGLNGFASDVRRYTYDSRKHAEAGSISDAIGTNGRIA